MACSVVDCSLHGRLEETRFPLLPRHLVGVFVIGALTRSAL